MDSPGSCVCQQKGKKWCPVCFVDEVLKTLETPQPLDVRQPSQSYNMQLIELQNRIDSFEASILKLERMTQNFYPVKTFIQPFRSNSMSLREGVEVVREKKKQRGSRDTFSTFTREVLWNHFVISPYPSRKEKEQIATRAGISFKQVDTYFSNTRKRVKSKTLFLRHNDNDQGVQRVQLCEPKRPRVRKNFPFKVTEILKKWYYERGWIYPTRKKKSFLRKQVLDRTGVQLSVKQISVYFTNLRLRYPIQFKRLTLSERVALHN